MINFLDHNYNDYDRYNIIIMWSYTVITTYIYLNETIIINALNYNLKVKKRCIQTYRTITNNKCRRYEVVC